MRQLQVSSSSPVAAQQPTMDTSVYYPLSEQDFFHFGEPGEYADSPHCPRDYVDFPQYWRELDPCLHSSREYCGDSLDPVRDSLQAVGQCADFLHSPGELSDSFPSPREFTESLTSSREYSDSLPSPEEYADSLHSPTSTGSDVENHAMTRGLEVGPSSITPSTSLRTTVRGGVAARRVGQRKAANMRERRRMKSINDAFETLRTCIPWSEAQVDRKLSKVDTLRLAMRYITFLSDLVQSCDDNDDDNYGGAGEGRGSSGRRGKVQEKVIVRCRVADPDEENGDSMTVLGHSLSWDDPAHPPPRPDCKMVAKIWTPENPTESDLLHLASYSCEY